MPTRAGIFALIAPFVLGIAAINAGNNLLFLLLGACLGVIALSGILSERAIRRIDATIRPIGDVRADEPARFTVRLMRPAERGRPSAAFGFRLRERIPRQERTAARPLDVELPVVDGPSGWVVATRVFARRGRARLGRVEAVTTYPFGLLAKSMDVAVECAVVVRPRRVEIPASLASPSGFVADGARSAARGLGQDLYGLRERQDHDPAHRVHALRSLALGREVVVEMEAVRRPTAWLGVANVVGAHQEAFERALEIAAAVIEAWDREGYAIGLATAHDRFDPDNSTVDRLLDLLAVLELEAGRIDDTAEEPFWLIPEGAALSGPLMIGHGASVSRTGSVALAGSSSGGDVR